MKKRQQHLQAMVDKANQYFAESDDSERSKAGRTMLASFVSELLMEAKSYHGFNYQYWNERGCAEWRAAGEPEGSAKDAFIYGPTGDKTRICYY